MLSSWWREYAECSEGPSGRPKKASSPESDQSPELFAVEEERVGVPVKGGLYEALFFLPYIFVLVSPFI